MILASGLLFACLFSLPARGSDSPDSAALRRVTEILRDNKSKTAQELAEQLVALGAGDVPALFEIYRSGTGGLAKPATDARVLALNEVQQAATLLALKRMTLPWHSLFEAMAPVERERAARWAAVHVIGEIGEAADVHLLLDLARPQPARPGAPAPADQVAGEDPSVIGDADAAEFEADVEHIIGRDAASLAQLEQQFFSTDAQLQPLLVQAISNAHSLAAVALLSHLLGVQKELDLTLVTGIAK